MINRQSDLLEAIYSDDYMDLLFDLNASILQDGRFYDSTLSLTPNPKYTIFFLDRSKNPELTLNYYNYYEIPHCYSTMDINVMNETGSEFLQNQSQLNVTGRGVLIGLLDTGIDYTHPAFINEAGQTKLYSIWDQTIISESPPEGLFYGTEYTSDMINLALQSDSPFDIVPSRDTSGHGTQMAGIAAGSRQISSEFSGMAPGSQLVIVKLKDAKPHLKRHYGIAEHLPAFQTTDILMGLTYLRNTAIRLRMPMVICLGLGTSLGGLTPRNPLEHYLENLAETDGFSVVTALGNEGLSGGTYIGSISPGTDSESVEILVGEEQGFTLELWGRPPNIYSVSVQNPFGETMPRTATRGRGTYQYSFVSATTRLQIDYLLTEPNSGQLVIQLRFIAPVSGIWTIHVYKYAHDNSDYIMKLPVSKFLLGDTRFLRPTPDYSLVKPSQIRNIISVTAYDQQTGNLTPRSSWGYANIYNIKPDLAAPGVNVLVPDLAHGYAPASGSSIAAACTAGSIALLFEWMLDYQIPWAPNTAGTKNFITRGTRRIQGTEFPNKQMGYGKLDLYGSYEQVLNF